MSVKLNGYITVPADRLEAIRAALPEHIRLTLAEPGCISFEVVEDAEDIGVFHVAEEFVDAESFEAHQTRAGASEWARVSAEIPRNYKITDLDT